MTRRLNLPILTLKAYKIPLSGLASSVIGGLIANDLLKIYGNKKIEDLKRETILSAKHLPLWSNQRYAVNPDRLYFELAD